MKDMKTAEIVAEYNRLTGESVKRFSTRAVAEARLAKARAAHTSAHPTTENHTAPKPVKKPVKEIKEPVSRSVAIAESWKSPAVAEKRAQRNHVVVGGAEYRSVREAFTKLGLPLAKHIAFRMELKAKGHATFEGHSFKLVESKA